MSEEVVQKFIQNIKQIYAVTYLNGLCKCMCICCGIQIIATVILAICIGCNVCNQDTAPINIKCLIIILGILGGIIFCSCIVIVNCFICIREKSRHTLLTAGYLTTLKELDPSYSLDTKSNRKMTLYQYYCQSLTKR